MKITITILEKQEFTSPRLKPQWYIQWVEFTGTHSLLDGKIKKKWFDKLEELLKFIGELLK